MKNDLEAIDGDLFTVFDRVGDRQVTVRAEFRLIKVGFRGAIGGISALPGQIKTNLNPGPTVLHGAQE